LIVVVEPSRSERHGEWNVWNDMTLSRKNARNAPAKMRATPKIKIPRECLHVESYEKFSVLNHAKNILGERADSG
jgi:hypothetical protein